MRSLIFLGDPLIVRTADDRDGLNGGAFLGDLPAVEGDSNPPKRAITPLISHAGVESASLSGNIGESRFHFGVLMR